MPYGIDGGPFLVVILDAVPMGHRPDLQTPSWADGRRTQRVILRIPILVIAQVQGEPPLKEDTATLVVNAHGALISLAMRVRPGQKVTVRNWGTAKEQEFRIIHVKENPFGKNEVGIAFSVPDPHFWNLDFPPPDWTPYLSDKK